GPVHRGLVLDRRDRAVHARDPVPVPQDRLLVDPFRRAGGQRDEREYRQPMNHRTLLGFRPAARGSCITERDSPPEPPPLDVLLDLVLSDPDLLVRLEVDQRRVDLVVDDLLAALLILDRLQLALEHVLRTELLAEPGPGLGSGVLMLILPLVTAALTIDSAGLV